jgi:aryl-alcohol dehydrogenase-like predicted oxidoreductase
MQYTLLGSTGLRVSELSLGTMTFGEDWGWGAGREACASMLDRYVDAGGNFIDTANNYTGGTSERILGDLLDEHGRDEFVVATKYTINTREGDPNAGGNHRKNMMRSVEGSLDRLDTDYIDLLWVHAWDGMTPVEEVMRGLDDLVSRGKVDYVGFSDTPAWVVARAHQLALERNWVTPAAVQLKYTLTERTPERELLPMARNLGLGVLVWGPLDGGLLTGKYLDDREVETDADAEADDEGRLSVQGREVSDREAAIASEVVAVADETGASPAQVALAWIRQQPGQLLPIVGARTPDQLTDNLGSIDVRLDEEHLDRLDEVSAVDMGFPHEFLSSPSIRRLLFGGTYDGIDADGPNA